MPPVTRHNTIWHVRATPPESLSGHAKRAITARHTGPITPYTGPGRCLKEPLSPQHTLFAAWATTLLCHAKRFGTQLRPTDHDFCLSRFFTTGTVFLCRTSCQRLKQKSANGQPVRQRRTTSHDSVLRHDDTARGALMFFNGHGCRHNAKLRIFVENTGHARP